MSLFNELKRRNVFRVGLAYMVSAWIIAQVTSLVLDSIKAPDWVMQALLLMLGLGFVVALIIAWAYELTPEGIKKEKDVVRDESVTNITAKKLDYITLAGVLLVVALFAYQQMNDKEMDSRLRENDTKVVEKTPVIPNNNSVIPAQAGTSSSLPETKTDSRLRENDSVIDDKSIAVLPFVDLSPTKDQEYFTDGLTENLLHALAQIREIKVAGRTSSFAFKNRNVDLREIGKTLNVHKILEGSVQKSGKRIRITAQLINTDDGFHIWSKVYDRDLVDIFAVQDEITGAVVMALRQSMLGKDELNGGYKGNYDAYNTYLLGLDYLKKRNKESFELAIEKFRKALDIDPNMALAWAGLSQAYTAQTGFGTNFTAGFERARAAALNAIELDPSLPEAYLALARVQQSYDWDWDGNEASLRRAYSLRPGDVDIMKELAILKSLRGKNTEALSDIEQALALDPLNETLQVERASMLMHFNRYQEALPIIQETVRKHPKRGSDHRVLALIYFRLGDYEQALEVIKNEKFNFLKLELEAIIYNKLNNKTLAQQKLKELIDTYGNDVSWQVASVYAAWGDADQAFAALQRGFEVRDPGLIYIKRSKLFDAYHDDPRYKAFLKKMGFK